MTRVGNGHLNRWGIEAQKLKSFAQSHIASEWESGFELCSLPPECVLLITCCSVWQKTQVTRADMAAVAPLFSGLRPFFLITLLCVVSIPSGIATAVFWSGRMPMGEKALQMIMELWGFLWACVWIVGVVLLCTFLVGFTLFLQLVLIDRECLGWLTGAAASLNGNGAFLLHCCEPGPGQWSGSTCAQSSSYPGGRGQFLGACL